MGGPVALHFLQPDLFGRPPMSLELIRSSPVSVLTDVSAAGLDDDGPPAAGLLLHQRHALPGLLVRVIGGAYCDLVLDARQAVQLNAAFTVSGGGERKVMEKVGGGGENYRKITANYSNWKRWTVLPENTKIAFAGVQKVGKKNHWNHTLHN